MEVFNHHTQVTDLLQKHFGDKEIVGIEIGTRGADLTKFLLWNLPKLKLYTVDPWSYEEGNLFEAGHPQEEHIEMRAHAFNALYEFGDRVEILPMKSDEAFDKLMDYDFGRMKVNFVWLDGDHTVATVERDILNGLKIVKPGGILGGHDHNTVLEAINKTLAGREIHQGEDQTWWVVL